MTLALPALEAEILAATRRKRMYSGFLLLLFVVSLAAGWKAAEGRNAGGFIDGLPQLLDFPAGVFARALEKAADLPGHMVTFFPALVETINIAGVATLIGGAFAVVLSFLATRDLGVPGWVVKITRRSMDVMRAFPELVIALILVYILGGSPVPAMVAIAFHTTGALGKLFSEVCENVDLKPVDGLASVGAGWVQRMRYSVLPQVAPNFISYALLRFEINIRASAIIAFVGGGTGIGGDLAVTINQEWRHDEAAAIFVLLFLAIVTVDQLSMLLRERLVGRAGLR